MTDQSCLMTREELSDWMTNEVQRFEGCQGSTVTVEHGHQTPYASGAHWFDNVVFTLGASARNKDAVLGRVGDLVRHARQHFGVRG